MLPLFMLCTITEFCVRSLALDNQGQKYCQTLGNKPLLAMNSLRTQKGIDQYLYSRGKTFTPYVVTVCFTRYTLLFQYVCLLFPICLPCVILILICMWQGYMLCRDTPHSRNSRPLACLRSHVLREHCNFESKQAFSITLSGRRPNKKVDSSFWSTQKSSCMWKVPMFCFLRLGIPELGITWWTKWRINLTSLWSPIAQLIGRIHFSLKVDKKRKLLVQ